MCDSLKFLVGVGEFLDYKNARWLAKASRNKNVRVNKEQMTRVPLDKRIGVRNMDTDVKSGKKV